MPAPVTTTIGPLETDIWTVQTGSTINPTAPDYFGILPTPSGLVLQLASNKPYGGALAKNVQPLPVQAPTLIFDYTLVIDEATLHSGQVVETDVKLTDASGWTYDGSFQFNIANGWMAQYGNPWKDTGVTIPAPLPGVPMAVSVAYKYDYVQHSIRIDSLTVDSVKSAIGAVIPAAKVGWKPAEIVTQLQLCNRGVAGGYALMFSGMSHTLK